MRSPERALVAALAMSVCAALLAEPPAAPSPLAIAGSKSLIEAKQCWELGKASSDVLVYARSGTIAKVDVSTIGLGDAQLCLGKCGTACKSPSPVLRLASVTEAGSQLCVVFPDEAFPGGSQLATGKIVAASASSSAEVSVSLSGATQPLGVTALIWGLGIALPAFFSGWLALVSYRKQKKIDDDLSRDAKSIEGQRGNAARRVKEVIGYLSYLKGKTDAEFAEGLRNQIDDGLALDGLSEEREKAIRDAIDRANRTAILDALAAAFPRHRADIEAVRR